MLRKHCEASFAKKLLHVRHKKQCDRGYDNDGVCIPHARTDLGEAVGPLMPSTHVLGTAIPLAHGLALAAHAELQRALLNMLAALDTGLILPAWPDVLLRQLVEEFPAVAAIRLIELLPCRWHFSVPRLHALETRRTLLNHSPG